MVLVSGIVLASYALTDRMGEAYAMVTPHYRRADDEGSTLIEAALASAADLKVTKRELRVRLAPQSSPHRTRAVGALCEELNQRKTVFPGSNLRLKYLIQDPS